MNMRITDRFSSGFVYGTAELIGELANYMYMAITRLPQGGGGVPLQHGDVVKIERASIMLKLYAECLERGEHLNGDSDVEVTAMLMERVFLLEHKLQIFEPAFEKACQKLEYVTSGINTVTAEQWREDILGEVKVDQEDKK